MEPKTEEITTPLSHEDVTSYTKRMCEIYSRDYQIGMLSILNIASSLCYTPMRLLDNPTFDTTGIPITERSIKRAIENYQMSLMNNPRLKESERAKIQIFTLDEEGFENINGLMSMVRLPVIKHARITKRILDDRQRTDDILSLLLGVALPPDDISTLIHLVRDLFKTNGNFTIETMEKLRDSALGSLEHFYVPTVVGENIDSFYK